MKRSAVKIGTRGSALALAQTTMVLERLRKLHPGERFEIVRITTTGDRVKSASRLREGGKGFFTKEIEQALLRKRVHLAVHSMKDVLTDLPRGLAVGAVLERATPNDVFIGRAARMIEHLKPSATVGTSSLRRQALLQACYSHVRVGELRGNLDTRLRKLHESRSRLAGIVVAAAGLERLGRFAELKPQLLPLETFVPAPAQGAVCIEIRGDDERTREIVLPLHHEGTGHATAAERALLARLEGGCQLPLGAHARMEDDRTLRLSAALCAPDGSRVLRAESAGECDDPEALAAAVETRLRDLGAGEILRLCRR